MWLVLFFSIYTSFLPFLNTIKNTKHYFTDTYKKLLKSNLTALCSFGYASTNPIVTGPQSHLVYHKVVYWARYYFLYI